LAGRACHCEAPTLSGTWQSHSSRTVMRLEGAFRALRPAHLHGTERRGGKEVPTCGSRARVRACLLFRVVWGSAFHSMFAGPALPFGPPAASASSCTGSPCCHPELVSGSLLNPAAPPPLFHGGASSPTACGVGLRPSDAHVHPVRSAPAALARLAFGRIRAPPNR
jgi:hypothetical protein